MSQDWVANLYTQATEADTTLSNMELMFATLKSLFSGASAPSNTVPYMPWGDSTKKVVKRRDDGDSAWFGVMHGDVNQKLWVYRNAAMEGWAVYSSVTDRVLALKGGSTYTTGAATAGSWTISGLTNAAVHTHTGPSHTHTVSTNTSATAVMIDPTAGSPSTSVSTPAHTHTGTAAAAGTGNTGAPSAAETISSAATWRVAAAVGTLQYLDL